MKIDTIAVEFPSLEIRNDQILDFIERFNPSLPKVAIRQYQRVVAQLLAKTGVETRFIRDHSKQERAKDLFKLAVTKALQEANLEKKDIDLLIYCGVGKGFLEPANGYFIANTLGIKCQSFDISDACMSWVRALDVANLFLKEGLYRHILIVNAEFSLYEHGYPQLFKLESLNQLKYTFPAFTIGEATTATIVSHSEQKWSFTYKSLPEFVDLCAIPLAGYKDFAKNPGRCNMNGVGRFYAYGKKMFDTAKTHMVPFVREVVTDIREPDLWFPHIASVHTAKEIGNALEVMPEKLYLKAFQKYGNIVSATIPASMKMAMNEKKLHRGHKVVLTPVSAGMTFAVVQFVF